MMWTGKSARKRARDGHQFISASARRRVRRIGGLSARAQRSVIKTRRAYKKRKPRDI